MLLAAAVLAGCGGNGTGKDAAKDASREASFAVCSGTPAVPFTPGLSVLSASGAYRAAIQEAAVTDASGGSAPGTGIGHDTFTVAVTPAADAGLAAAPDGLTMSVPPVPSEVPADPYMPVHKHGGSTIPAIAAQGGGVFAVSGIDFFMGGYWQLYLDLHAGTAAADRVTFSICIAAD